MQIRVLTAGLRAAVVAGGIANTRMDQHSVEFPVGWSWYLARSRILFCSCESPSEPPSFLQLCVESLDAWLRGCAFQPSS